MSQKFIIKKQNEEITGAYSPGSWQGHGWDQEEAEGGCGQEGSPEG